MASPRHLNPAERQEIARIADECGLPELLRLVGQIVANTHPDLDQATEMRNQLCLIAKKLDGPRDGITIPF